MHLYWFRQKICLSVTFNNGLWDDVSRECGLARGKWRTERLEPMLRGNCSANPDSPESQERVHPGWAAVSAPVARWDEVRAWPLKLGVKRWSSLSAMTSFSNWMTGELWSSSLIMTMKRMMGVTVLMRMTEVMLVVVTMMRRRMEVTVVGVMVSVVSC